jgi:cytosine/uracil/thiamine/allantoin permease
MAANKITAEKKKYEEQSMLHQREMEEQLRHALSEKDDMLAAKEEGKWWEWWEWWELWLCRMGVMWLWCCCGGLLVGGGCGCGCGGSCWSCLVVVAVVDC